MKLYIFLLITLFLLYLVYKRFYTIREGYIDIDSQIVKSFKVRIGLWYEPGFEVYYKFIYDLSNYIPIEITRYKNKYEPFYDLKRRNIDLVFSTEKDYMIYWLNQKKRSIRLVDSFRRVPEIQMITASYYVYYLVSADFNKVISKDDINNCSVQLSPTNHLGLDSEYEIFEDFKVHFKHRTSTIQDGYDDLTKDSDILLNITNHPNKIVLEESNKKDIYLLGLDDLNNKKEFFDKYLFLNRVKLDLKYYPKIKQRWNSRNRMGSLLIDGSGMMETYGTKTLLLGLDLLNDSYIFEFLKIYFGKIDTIRQKYIYYDNFGDKDMSYSRLTYDNRVLSLHKGARDFYKRIGSISLNPSEKCYLIANECTKQELTEYGDFLQ